MLDKLQERNKLLGKVMGRLVKAELENKEIEEAVSIITNQKAF